VQTCVLIVAKERDRFQMNAHSPKQHMYVPHVKSIVCMACIKRLISYVTPTQLHEKVTLDAKRNDKHPPVSPHVFQEATHKSRNATAPLPPHSPPPPHPSPQPPPHPPSSSSSQPSSSSPPPPPPSPPPPLPPHPHKPHATSDSHPTHSYPPAACATTSCAGPSWRAR